VADAVAITIVLWFWQHQNPLCLWLRLRLRTFIENPGSGSMFCVSGEGLIAKLFSLIIIVIEDRRGSNGSMQGFK